MEFIESGYRFWKRYYDFKRTDARIEPFLASGLEAYKCGSGWLKDAREALFLPMAGVAQKLKVTRAAYAELEKNEEKGTITLNALARAAEALDCELVYAIRPKGKMPFSKVIWQILLEKSVNHSWVKTKPANAKDRALAAIARYTMVDPKFRRLKGWSKRVRISL